MEGIPGGGVCPHGNRIHDDEIQVADNCGSPCIRGYLWVACDRCWSEPSIRVDDFAWKGVRRYVMIDGTPVHARWEGLRCPSNRRWDA